MKKSLQSWLLFLREFCKNPGAVGSACPSSESLGEAMIQQIPKSVSGLVVELGAGTGAITQVLTRYFSTEQLIVIEHSRDLCNFLQKKFPAVKIIEGDAVQFLTQSSQDKLPIEVIISCLPLRSLKKDTLSQIQTGVNLALKSGGYLVQFTYDPRPNAAAMLPTLKYIGRKMVWANLPPARIDVYQK